MGLVEINAISEIGWTHLQAFAGVALGKLWVWAALIFSQNAGLTRSCLSRCRPALLIALKDEFIKRKPRSLPAAFKSLEPLTGQK
jgi:hypothetical protein